MNRPVTFVPLPMGPVTVPGRSPGSFGTYAGSNCLGFSPAGTCRRALALPLLSLPLGPRKTHPGKE